jgi:hypothetical protein
LSFFAQILSSVSNIDLVLTGIIIEVELISRCHKMFKDILNDWRRLLLLKEERFSLSEIFALSPKDLRELQVSQRLGAPSFMRMDEKRWCQASV